MTPKDADLFMTHSTYGIIIRLSDLSYSWFNRYHKEVKDESQDVSTDTSKEDKSWDELYSFKNTLKDESVLAKLKEFASRNSEKGVNIREKMNEGKSYIQIWLYDAENTPYYLGKEVPPRMEKYYLLLHEIESILI